LGEYALRNLGELRLDQIGVAEIDDMLLALERRGGRKTEAFPQGKPLAAKTVREIAFLVAGCFRKAVARNLVNKSPFDGDVQIPEADQKEAPSLDAGQLATLLQAAAGTRLYPLIMLACATGCRRGELLALTWNDIDFQTGTLNVCKSLEETRRGVRIKSTKSGKPRSFRVPKQALDSLEDWREQQEQDRRMYGADYATHELIFCRPDGEYYKPDKVSVRVTDLATKAGLKGVGLHSLRHSHASHLLSNGTPIPTVAKRLGHKNANVTLSIYSHALPADEIAAAEVWNNSLGKVISETRSGGRLSQVITGGVKMRPQISKLKKIG
jgi:integrase